MKKALIVFSVFLLFSCSDSEEPIIPTAQVLVGQRANLNTVFFGSLVVSGQDINSAFDTSKGYSGFNIKFEEEIQEGQPFAFVIDIQEFTGVLNVILKINDANLKGVEIFEKPDLPEVYIHPNGNRQAAQQMADAITFDSNVIILD